MNRVFEILSLVDNEVDSYVNKRVAELNKNGAYKKVTLPGFGDDENGEIFHNWINTSTPYFPSGFRAKGFKMDIKFIKDFILTIKKDLGKIPLDILKITLTEDALMHWIYYYIILYLGNSCDKKKRNEIYNHGFLNFRGETLNISDLKDLSVARCVERSAALNAILNYLDIDSSLVMSYANNIGHAYCLLHKENKYYIFDPNADYIGTNARTSPYIFEINPHNDSFTFDPSVFGDKDAMKVTYSFPNSKMSGMIR